MTLSFVSASMSVVHAALCTGYGNNSLTVYCMGVSYGKGGRQWTYIYNHHHSAIVEGWSLMQSSISGASLITLGFARCQAKSTHTMFVPALSLGEFAEYPTL